MVNSTGFWAFVDWTVWELLVIPETDVVVFVVDPVVDCVFIKTELLVILFILLLWR